MICAPVSFLYRVTESRLDTIKVSSSCNREVANAATIASRVRSQYPAWPQNISRSCRYTFEPLQHKSTEISTIHQSYFVCNLLTSGLWVEPRFLGKPWQLFHNLTHDLFRNTRDIYVRFNYPHLIFDTFFHVRTFQWKEGNKVINQISENKKCYQFDIPSTTLLLENRKGS